MSNSLVSIIIPTYNRADLIGETLDSVMAQSYVNWECIIIDDGSKDATETVIQKYIALDTRFQYYKRPEHLPGGGNAARNYGFEQAKGEFVQWFDDDDIMLEDYIGARIRLFSDEVQMVLCTGYMVDEHLNDKTFLPIKLINSIYKDYVLYTSKIMIESIMFRRSYLMQQDRLFRTDLTRAQESELFLRLFYTIQKDAYVILETPLFLYRQHALTKTTKDKVYNKSFKRSRSIIYADNLKKSIVLRDQKLVTILYHNLLAYFFEGIKNDHKTNSKWILKELVKDMRQVSSNLSMMLWVLGSMSLIFNYPFYRFHKMLKFHPSLKTIS